MKELIIILTAIIGISTTIYLVKEPVHPRVVQKPETPLDEYTERLNKAKIACNNAGGVLITDDRGQSACALLKSRWITG